MLDEHIAPANFGIFPKITFFQWEIPTYTVFMILAFICGFICYKLTANKLNALEKSHRTLIVIYALLGGVIGAKLPILIFNIDLWFQYPQNINLLLSGKTIVGGLIGGAIAVFFIKKRLHITIKTGNDIAAPAALGMAIGRLGCFFGGCCYGIESPKFLGVDFGDGVYRFPTQIYEIIFDLTLFFIFLYFKKNKELKPGILFRYLLNGYLSFRFPMEFIRETDQAFFGISYYQILCVICLLFINRKWIITAVKKHFHTKLPPQNMNVKE
ncbi:prolipoprotein diacylglyceryl transferase [Paludicola sp. MB14-C6]|uniref:prolipoprotein diacylglyceryl transferase n=1 Tax=Paludihabitans sp. MB14-C6 TaxID=3070656 RepID=UPI0027DC4310|nr:prolipoprotein diacylglyceryl transferase family protein [Paludicola sp. MB14-C6]WMJ24031.1 prolipoprotein diacylglyceryl transferase [Paludicola sp. MB14-C6]